MISGLLLAVIFVGTLLFYLSNKEVDYRKINNKFEDKIKIILIKGNLKSYKIGFKKGVNTLAARMTSDCYVNDYTGKNVDMSKNIVEFTFKDGIDGTIEIFVSED